MRICFNHFAIEQPVKAPNCATRHFQALLVINGSSSTRLRLKRHSPVRLTTMSAWLVLEAAVWSTATSKTHSQFTLNENLHISLVMNCPLCLQKLNPFGQFSSLDNIFNIRASTMKVQLKSPPSLSS